MTTAQSAASTQPSYDNNGQYSRAGILRYEKIFGAGYVSTGGPETTAYLCSKLQGLLRPGMRVLDVGSGIGGAAFHLARSFGAVVTGVDLSEEMVGIALERARQEGSPSTVSFQLADILTVPFDGKFDIVWSRDALMHIPDKPRLFSRLYDLLDAGGQLIVTDYARGTSRESADFRAYVAQTGYHLTDPASYGKLLENAGFTDVEVEDATDKFVQILRNEADRLGVNRADFLATFREEDLNYLVERWAMKVGFCKAGEMKWGIYRAGKRA